MPVSFFVNVLVTVLEKTVPKIVCANDEPARTKDLLAVIRNGGSRVYRTCNHAVRMWNVRRYERELL
jgi:hypothetical protein